MKTLNHLQALKPLENDYSRDISLEHRKKFAQFFTPPQIAELMVRWILGAKNLRTVLEPAFGLGIFSRILLERKKDLLIKGFEIDPLIFRYAKSAFKGCDDVSLFLEDYIYNDWDAKYDAIICNPPYFKFHDFDRISGISELEKRLSLKLSGFTNLYTLFLLKSLYQLKDGGRCAYLVPSEFLNSDYGRLIKSFLLKEKSLRHVVVIDFKQTLFDDALTTASLLLCAKDGEYEGVGFTTVSDIRELHSIEKIIEQYSKPTSLTSLVSFDQLNPNLKWSSYYREQKTQRYKNLVPFSRYGRVVRGIATGANDFFTFSSAKARRFGISDKYLLPTICKSADVKGPFFTSESFEELRKAERPAFLLNSPMMPERSVSTYLRLGEDQGIHERYLTASRNPWFSLEKRPPSPIWVSVFNRNGVRFIRNEANVSNLTTFHCIYLNLFSEPKADLFMAYLLTDLSHQILGDHRREYGDGLQKFEPNDINNSQIVDLSLLDVETEQKILDLYYSFRDAVILQKDVGDYILEIDYILKHNFSA